MMRGYPFLVIKDRFKKLVDNLYVMLSNSDNTY